MNVSPGLSVSLSIPLSKFERQLARAEAAAVKRANNIQRKFNEANGRGAQSMTKSAAASAQVFEQAMQKETREFQRLKASVDPAWAAQQRYEAAVRQVESAVRMGAVSQKEANAVLQMTKAAHLGAGAAITSSTGQMGQFFNMSRQGRAVLMNTTNQVADMAVQFEMGTNPLRIMGQQVPQLAAGFGMLGGTLGLIAPLLATVAAIGFPVAAFLLASGDNAEDSAEKIKDFADAFDKVEAAINRADAAISRAASGNHEKLREVYGEVNAAVLDLVQALARQDVESALVRMDGAFDKFFEENDEVDGLHAALENRRQAIEDVQKALGVAEKSQSQSGLVDDSQLDSLIAYQGELAAITNKTQADLEELADVNAEIAQLQEQWAGNPAAISNVKALTDQLARLSDISDIEVQFDIDPEAIVSFKEIWEGLQSALQVKDLEAAADKLGELRNLLESLPDDSPLKEAAGDLSEIEHLARRSSASVKGLERAANSVNFDGATASASRMADEISRAADALHAMKSQGVTDLQTAKIRYEYRNDPVGMAGVLAGSQFDRDQSVRTAGGFGSAAEEAYYDAERAAVVRNARKIAVENEKSRPQKKRSGGGRGKDELSLFDQSDKQFAALERQIQMMGKSRREVVALTAKYGLLDAARAKGIDLDRVSAQTGRTLREEIDLRAQSIADLSERVAQTNAQSELFADLGKDLKSSILDAATASGSLSDGLEQVARSLQRAAVEAALWGTGPMGAIFGGGGGGLLGGLFRGLKIPGYAAGTDFAPGGIADVGENGRERVYLPRGSKVIPNHKLGQGGGVSRVDVFVHPSGEFDARVEQVSGNVAVNVSGQMISENNRQISQMQRR